MRTCMAIRQRGRAFVAMLATAACGGDGEASVEGSAGAQTDTGISDAGATLGDDGDPSTTGAATSPTGATTSETTAEIDDPGIFDVHAIPDGAVGTGTPECGCAPGTDLIYVLSDLAELWSFDPVSLDFELISSFVCDGLTATFSMGVDRNAIAWVMFQTGDIYNLDINDPAVCIDPGYTPNQLGFDLFGMAYVSEGEDNPCDQLYAHSFSGGFGFQEGPGIGKLGTVDPDTLQMQQLGIIDYDGGELSGTGDGRLFAFAGAAPAKLVEYDKTDATVIDTLPLASLELTNAFAFAFFGGDFYFFTEGAGLMSQVTHIDYDGTQDLEVVVPQAPIRIVGAGVSTCAPVVPPG